MNRPSAPSSPLAVSTCPQCGGQSARPGEICLTCAGIRALSGENFSLPRPVEHDPAAKPGAVTGRIGPYEIVDEIGRGGMGWVYAARQGGLGRIVALKVLPEGRGAAGLELRFLREVQTAARLRHPHIVTVHDFGRADGYVYFSMDYCEDGDLARRLRERPFTPRAAAAFVADVAEALAYTHREGVLHRDLKPSNILLEGDRARLADFGLAAQLEPGGDLTAVTGPIGTPHYLAPEAFHGGSAALTERSDLYALGVILFEMLTGRVPFAGATPAELTTLVTTAEPPAPRLLAPAVPRDLETICLQCLERDPADRYADAAALAADLRRFLAGEPIAARPPGRLELVARFARRHRTGFAVAGAFVLLLLAATAVSTSLAVRARRAEQAAVAEARTSRALADFLQNDLLAQASPGEEPDRDIKLRTVLDRAATRIDGRFAHDPLLEADIRKTIGFVYDSLGEYEPERAQLEQAFRLRSRELGPDHPRTLAARGDLAEVLHTQGKLEDASRLLEQVLATQRRALGRDHPDTLHTADARAANLFALGRVAEAEALQIETLVASRRVLGPKDARLLLGLSTLGSIRLQQARLPEAEALMQEAVDIETASRGPDHPDTLTALNNLAAVYRDEGKFGEAARLHARIADARRRVLGPEHHDTLLSLNNLAGAYKALGRLDEAEKLQRDSVEIARRTLGPEQLEVMIWMGNLADTYRREDKLADAATLFAETLALRRRVLGPAHPHTLINLDQLGDTLLRQGKPAEAEPCLREAFETRLKNDPGHWQTAAARSQLGVALARLRREAEAEPLLLEGYAALVAGADRIPPIRRHIVAEAGAHIVEFYAAWGRPQQAAEWQTRLAATK